MSWAGRDVFVAAHLGVLCGSPSRTVRTKCVHCGSGENAQRGRYACEQFWGINVEVERGLSVSA